ncbi:hypothetical protein SAMD00023353_1001820 [Rosellinia necatrix]|uniref:Uncharacterized protein n=1 Tax=Rosellinia necatrix TaxID=77044 RepID=A0A1S8A6B9_ROSNE|nr:hypothetical protein SAMD00023353_1001820 [Rosellinia necatrix]
MIENDGRNDSTTLARFPANDRPMDRGRARPGGFVWLASLAKGLTGLRGQSEQQQ